MPPLLPPPDLPGASAFSRWGDHRHLAVLLAATRNVAALTGAGLSAPSGIPTYRGAGGRWTAEEPIRHEAFVRGGEPALAQWRRSLADLDAFADAAPNAGHRALARLAARSDLGVATQNVDGLHQEAGLPPDRLVELHGNGRRAVCMACRALGPLGAPANRDAVAAGRQPACAACGGPLKPDVVLFGDDVPAVPLGTALRAAADCTVFLALGTSLQVDPAAALARVAVESGAVLVIAVDGVTPYHGAAHLLIAGDVVEALDRAVPAD